MSVSIFPSWTVLPLFQGFTSFWLFRTFWRFDVLNNSEKKVSQSATFELAQGDPIWLLVRRLNHSANSARQNFFNLCRWLYVCLTAVWAFTFLRCYVKTIFLRTFDRLMSLVVWTEFIQTQQDLNLSWMDPCDFFSHAPALRNDCNLVSLFLSVSVIVSWTVLILFSLSHLLFLIVSDFLMLWCLDFWCN